MSPLPAPRFLAEHIIVDHTEGTITVNGEPFGWSLAPGMYVRHAEPDDGLLAEVTVTIIGQRVATDARGGLLAIDDRALPWYISETGPRVETADSVFRVTVDLLADIADEVGADDPGNDETASTPQDHDQAIGELLDRAKDAELIAHLADLTGQVCDALGIANRDDEAIMPRLRAALAEIGALRNDLAAKRSDFDAACVHNAELAAQRDQAAEVGLGALARLADVRVCATGWTTAEYGAARRLAGREILAILDRDAIGGK
ncbi:hypothetical protein NONO_c17610 [Nocardia nova SH22a]|uniref:Uncharacterized protein n=1 Tax=Nocardia nova SH22a TaxID=1415166 RepID=W5TH36_9NOCA|nr:hypothetical protein [Nocardia nova]AHH16561.1 hypothetical protein NONO_c17610 [Nocardia nova SH22a]